MKFCRFLTYMLIVQSINSCFSESVTKSGSPAESAGKSSIHTDGNDSIESHKILEQVTTNSLSVGKTPPEQFKDTPSEISENVGQASQIQSSFEEVPEPDGESGDVAVHDKLGAVLNQGTLSREIADTGTVVVVSLSDSATADLHKLASSASANVKDSNHDKAVQANTTSGLAAPIVILPQSESDLSKSQDQDAIKSDSSSPSIPISEESQPPIVIAEPKVVENVVSQESHTVPEAQPSQEPSKPQDATHASPTTGSPLDLVTVPASEIPQEEIPSFSEWTQKQLEEAEKKKDQNNTANPPAPARPAPRPLRSKNYASPDCGAKIVAANPEAENPSGVLANSKDEYLINKCSTQRMWLVIELCEPVQAKKIELANFELFSSSPKDFSVYLSHSYPSRDWASVGQFTAKDERTVQSFNLQPHLFGKFLKVEFNSHYGKEHFCCTSLIHVFGTSEFEVLETENEVHSAVHDLDDEDEDEQPIGVDTGKPTKNLFGHATDAVYTIVRKAAEVLVKSGESRNQSKTTEPKNTTALIPSFRRIPQHCSTLRHLVVCNNCSEDFFHKVYHLLSCQPNDMQALIESPFVFDGINNSQLCSLYGLDFVAKRVSSSPLRLRHEDQLDQAGYLAAMLPAEYISALCNILAVLEGKVVLNTSQASLASGGGSPGFIPVQDSRETDLKNLLIEHQTLPTCSVGATLTQLPCQQGGSSPHSKAGVSTALPGSQPGLSSSSIASEIKPTKTLAQDEVKDISAQKVSQQGPVQNSETTLDVKATNTPSSVKVEPSSIPIPLNSPVDLPTDKSKFGSPTFETAKEPTKSDQPAPEAPPTEKEKEISDASFNIDSVSSDDQEQSKDLDALFLEMKALDNEEASTESTSSYSGSSTTPSSVVTQTRVNPSQAQKESVFLRLSNKIKALERNMSLSGQYLEELSRRYKKQEELSRALNKTIVVLREEVRKSKDREHQRDSDLHFLRTQLIQLTATIESYQSEKDSWQHKAVVVSQHFVLIVIEVFMFGVVVWMCRRLPSDSGGTPTIVPQRKWSTSSRKPNKSHAKQLRRRNSLDVLSSSGDLRKRRPSEEALHIGGSYKDLLVPEENIIVVEGEEISSVGNDSNSWLSVSSSRDQRRRRKRKKEGLIRSSSSNNLHEPNSESVARKISAPVHSLSLPSDGCVNESLTETRYADSYGSANLPFSSTVEEMNVSEMAWTPSHSENGHALNHVPAAFMETATSMRNRRSFTLAEAQLPFHAVMMQDWRNQVEGDSGSSASGQSSRSKGLDSLEPVGSSIQLENPDVIVGDKKKKASRKGLKSMVKKFF